MKHRCPKCGHEFDDGAQATAAKARWKRTKKKDRSAEMSRIALIRHAKNKAANASNAQADSPA